MALSTEPSIDITLKCDDWEIVVNRELLIEKSCVFKAMLTHPGFEEYNADVLTLDVCRPFLKVLLDYLSGNIVNLDGDNIIEVMDGCSTYQLTELYIDTAIFIKSCLTLDNCMKFLYYSKMYNFVDLKSYILKFCCKHFKDTPEDQYKVHSLIVVLKSKILNEEESVLLRYIAGSKEMSFALKKLFMAEIKFSLVPSDCLNKLILSKDLIEKQVDIRNSLTERSKYRATFKEHQLSDRRCKQERSVVLALNGIEECRTMECLIYKDSRWRLRIPARMVDNLPSREMELQCQNYNRSDTATAYDDYHVYVIGGIWKGYFLSTCAKFFVRENAWSSFPDLPMPIFGHSVVMCEARIFLTGGVNSAVALSIYAKAIHTQWRYETNLPDIRSYHCSVGAFGFLYVMGGFLGNTSENPTSSMIRYNLLSQTWEEMPSMTTARARMSAVCRDTQIYVFGGRDASGDLRSCEKFDIKQNRWIPIADMSQAKSLTAAVWWEGRILITGGESNGTVLCTSDTYNPVTDVWHSTHSMQFARSSHGLAVLQIPEMTSNELVIPDDFWKISTGTE